jgi:hypothetical protein
MRIEIPSVETAESAAHTVIPELISGLSHAGEESLSAALSRWLGETVRTSNQTPIGRRLLPGAEHILTLDGVGIRAKEPDKITLAELPNNNKLAEFRMQDGPLISRYAGTQFAFLQQPSTQFSSIDIAGNIGLRWDLAAHEFPEAFRMSLAPDSRVVTQFTFSQPGWRDHVFADRIPVSSETMHELLAHGNTIDGLSKTLLNTKPPVSDDVWKARVAELIVHSPARSTSFTFFPRTGAFPDDKTNFLGAFPDQIIRRNFRAISAQPEPFNFEKLQAISSR